MDRRTRRSAFRLHTGPVVKPKRPLTLTAVAALGLLALPLLNVPSSAAAGADACSPEIRDLGTLGGKWSEILETNHDGIWVGAAAAADRTGRAVLWDGDGIHDLGAVGESLAFDVNNAGTVVGVDRIDEEGAGRAFVWRDGVIEELPGLPGGGPTGVRRLNEQGDAVGSAVDADGVERPAIWMQARDLVTLPVPDRFDGAYAMAINESGDVVGAAYRPRKLIAWGWDADGTNHELARLDKHGFSAANVLDDVGRAAGLSDFGGNPGAQAALWRGGRERHLGVFGESDFSFALATNGYGDFSGVGTYFVGEDAAHVFLSAAAWRGELRTLMPLSGDPTDDSTSHAVSGGKVMVGGSSQTVRGRTHATVWTCAYRQAFVPSEALIQRARFGAADSASDSGSTTTLLRPRSIDQFRSLS